MFPFAVFIQTAFTLGLHWAYSVSVVAQCQRPLAGHKLDSHKRMLNASTASLPGSVVRDFARSGEHVYRNSATLLLAKRENKIPRERRTLGPPNHHGPRWRPRSIVDALLYKQLSLDMKRHGDPAGAKALFVDVDRSRLQHRQQVPALLYPH